MDKKQRKLALRALIDRYPMKRPFEPADVEAFNKLTGWTFIGYKRIPNPTWKNDMRCIAHTADGTTWEVWSWNKAVDNYGGFQDMLEAMRLAVQPQMRKFAIDADSSCAVCGSEDMLSVDHKDVPFIVLARDFINDRPGMSAAIDNDGTGAGWYIKDPDVLDTWVRFHKVNATYQVLCRSCNSKKGAKHDTGERET